MNIEPWPRQLASAATRSRAKLPLGETGQAYAPEALQPKTKAKVLAIMKEVGDGVNTVGGHLGHSPQRQPG